jgi:hypothetical protein
MRLVTYERRAKPLTAAEFTRALVARGVLSLGMG